MTIASSSITQPSYRREFRFIDITVVIVAAFTCAVLLVAHHDSAPTTPVHPVPAATVPFTVSRT